MKTFVSGLALATLVSGTALAATSTAPAPAAAQTSASAQAIAGPKLIDKVTAQIAGTFTGPSVAAITGNDDNASASQTSDANGDADGAINFEGALRAGYKVTPATTVSGNLAFIAYPVRGEGVKLLDPYLQVATAGIIKSGNLTTNGSLRVYAPTSTGSVLASKITSLRLTESSSYSVGRWSLGLDGFVQAHFYGQNIMKSDKGSIVEQNGAKQATLFISPNLSYQITPTVAATVAYEAATSHFANADMKAWKSEGSWLYPGVSWDVTPAINVNPYLQLNSSRANPEAVLLGANLSAKFL